MSNRYQTVGTAVFQRLIGCLLLLKGPDLSTRMFGELWPQGHAGKTGWTLCWDGQ